MEQNPPANQQKKGRMSAGAKFGIGCAALVVIVLLITCGTAIYFIFWGIGEVKEYAEEYQNKGYVHVSGQVIPVQEKVTQRTVFTGQSIEIQAGSEASIAIMGQSAEIHGTVDGDVDFFGQVRTINEDAVVTGDVRVRGAQLVNAHGDIRGELTGNWQTLNPSDWEQREFTDDATDADGLEVDEAEAEDAGEAEQPPDATSDTTDEAPAGTATPQEP